jgi:hypothetical protein
MKKQFRKSSFSPNPFSRSLGCVAVAFTEDGITVIDSKNPEAASLNFSHYEWHAFIKGVKNGEFDSE